MSLPGAYVNPKFTPCGGNYTWVPETPPNIGNLNYTIGFQNLIIDRGKFRNYYVDFNGVSNIAVSSGVSSSFIKGDLYSPIINATRPVSLSFSVKASNNNNAVIEANGSSDLIIFSDLDKTSGGISSIQISYDLSMWLQDEALYKFNLNSTQLNALNAMKGKGSVDDLNMAKFIAGLLPKALKIIGIKTDGSEIELPLDGDNKGLQITRLRNNETEDNLQYATVSASFSSLGPIFNTTWIKLKQETRDRSVFPTLKQIILRSNGLFDNSSLVLALKKIMFFTADRVNFNTEPGKKQLPCNAIGYSMAVNGKWYPVNALFASAANSLASSFFWPQTATSSRPTVHVKLFCPDYTSNSPGFAHSLNVHLFIVSFPVFGPLSDLLLPGVALPYFGVIVGPTPFTQQLAFTGTSLVSSNTNKTAVVSSPSFKQNSGTVLLLQDNVSQKTFNILPYSKVISLAQNFYNTYEYSASGTTKITQFQNLYTDLFGIQTKSEIYNGSPARSTQYLRAFSKIQTGNIVKSRYTYQSYIIFGAPSLYDVFTNSEPALIFKCETSDNLAKDLILEPGFISASINGFVTDKVGIFDTKILYRIYAVPKGGAISPASNLKHTMKITNTGETSPGLEFSSFDSSWDFNNVLVSGVLSSKNQEISIDAIINESKTLNISNSEYDIYCAIYAISLLNDSPKSYNLSQYSSLDFPLITFVIDKDFSLILPIYYLKSYSGGGTLQAIKDFGYTGSYVKDLSIYKNTNKYYSGIPYDSKDIYSGVLGSANSYYDLLTMEKDFPGDSKFKIDIGVGVANSPAVNEYDFVLMTKNLSFSKINSGTWEFAIDIDEKLNSITGLWYKFEVDLINPASNSLIYKIVSTEYSKDKRQSVNISVPFFLPKTEGTLILRLMIKNFGGAGILYLDDIKMLANTIEYFEYNQTSAAGRAPIGFYEDLPLQPFSYIGGCSDFFLKIDIPESGAVIFDPADGLLINGVIYSPTWISNLPEKMELDYRGVINSSLLPRATGVQPYQIFFRTGSGNQVKVLDSKRDKSSGLIVTITNQKTNTSDYAVKQIVSESYARFFRLETFLQTLYANGNVVELTLQNPVMANSDELLIEGQIESFKDIKTVALNLESPGTYASQPQFVGQFSPIDDDGYIRQKLHKTQFVSFDHKNNKTYSVGASSQGNLIYAEDAVISAQPATQFLLIEGNPSSSELTNPTVTTFSSENYYGLVSPTYPAIITTGDDNVVVFYVYKSGTSIIPGHAIYARVISGSKLYSPMLLLDLKQYFTQSGPIDYAFPQINQLSVAHHDIYPYGREYYLTFDCFGKIFLIKVLFNNTQNAFDLNFTDMAFVYGNLQNATNALQASFISSINRMIDIGAISKLNYLSQDSLIYNADIEGTQRFGIVDFDGFYMGIQFLSGSDIMEIVFEKSYAIKGELRKIGSIL